MPRGESAQAKYADAPQKAPVGNPSSGPDVIAARGRIRCRDRYGRAIHSPADPWTGRQGQNPHGQGGSRPPACLRSPRSFSPPGTRFIGKTYIGVRCLAPNVWSVLVPSQISITGEYVTSSRPLRAGHTVSPDDLTVLTGDLANLPTGVVTDPQAAVGKTLRNSLGTGQPLRSDQLLAPTYPPGANSSCHFTRRRLLGQRRGRALNNAAEGQLAQVRMNSGQTVSGIVRADGSVEISFRLKF